MKTTVGEIAERVFVGLATHGRSIALSDADIRHHQECGIKLYKLQYLTPSAISGSRLSFDNLDTVSFTSNQFARYCIQPEDVLVVCKGTSLRSVVTPENTPQCVLASSLIAIRLKKATCRPELLSAYLNHSSAIKWLVRRSEARTSAISISVKTIEEVSLDIPDRSVQDKLCETYSASLEHYSLSLEIADEFLRRAHSLVASNLECGNG